MPRLLGVNIPDKKKINISLTYIFGIGQSRAQKILQRTDIDSAKRAQDLSADQLNEIKKDIEGNYKVEGELRQQVNSDIQRLKQIECWRGIRHKKGLPVRGQRTQSNSRTVRGNVRKTVSSGRRKAPTPK